MNKNKIAAAFNKAANSYQQAAIVQQEIGNKLLAEMCRQKVKPHLILDAGCGTGFFSKKLSDTFPAAEIIGVDIAKDMIKQAKLNWQHEMIGKRIKFLCADMDNLPLNNQNMDLVFANCVLQWSLNLSVTLREINRILRKDGYLFFATFVEGTLQEMSHIWKSIGKQPPVNFFATIDNIKNSLKNSRFLSFQIKPRTLSLQFSSLLELMYYLKSLGANYAKRSHHCYLGKKKLSILDSLYKKLYNYQTTFNLVYGWAQK